MQIVTSTTPTGILTRTANVPGRTFGSLAFGVGTRDEPVDLAGITHLVLHLVEAALEPKLIPSRIFLDENSIRFDASGTTAQVLSHFRAVADAVVALGSVTSYELGRAKHLLDLEEPSDFRHPGVNLLTFRYGLGEIGRAGFRFPGVSAFGKKDVARWAASRLVAGNAAVALTKPLTASFDLDLPAGERPARGVAVPLLDTPTLLASENAGVGASITVPSAGSGPLAEAVRLALVERLVDQAGLVWSVDGDIARIDEQTADLTFSVRPAFGDIPETTRILVQALHDIADDGVSPAALALAAENTKLELASDPASVRDSLAEAAALELRGFTPETREERLAAAVSATPESVAATVTAALSTLVVAYDDEADVAKVAKALKLPIEPFQLLRPAAEKLWKKAAKAEGVVVFTARMEKGEPDAEAIVTETALLERYDGESVAAVDFDDLILVGERPDGTLVLVDGSGRWLPFEAGDFRSGKRFLKALRKALPAELRRDFAAL